MLSTASVDWRVQHDGSLVPFLVEKGQPDREIHWTAQPGSQEAFLSCPVFECLLEGNRGGGKTDALLMDFAQHVGEGWGPAWRGILFRRTYPELEDVIAKSKSLFAVAFPKAKFNEAKSFWSWPTGERLFFRQFIKPRNYWSYHGHNYPWIAWEELTTWPSPDCYTSMFACCRSAVVGIPKKIRSTTNPYGVGHNWVKHRFRLPIAGGERLGPIIKDSLDFRGKPEPPRIAIHSALSENKVLLAADPDYIDRIAASAANPQMLQAWIDGSWDIVAGGMFDDLWNPAVHMIKPFPIPENWRIDRSMDWGGSHPFSVGWWAESNGETVKLPDGSTLHTIRGDLFRVREWYGWNKRPNQGLNLTPTEIAEGIKKREKDWFQGRRVLPGPADGQIFGDGTGRGQSHTIAAEMNSEGVKWLKADKGQNSRKNGAQQLRTLLKNADPKDQDGNNIPREKPGLFIFMTCEQFKRTVPGLPRSDKDLDDVDSESEDHVYDEVRYKIYRKKQTSGRKSVRGR